MENTGEIEKKWYTDKEDYPKFDVNMTAGDLKTGLARAIEIYEDVRWQWMPKLRLELLTKRMSNELKRKIKTDTGLDPDVRDEWTYENLENAIKKNSVTAADPMKLARDFLTMIKSDKIDKVNENIEKFFEEMDYASRGVQCERIDALGNRRAEAEDAYKNEDFKKIFKGLLLRSSLSIEVAETTRTFEISNK